MIFDSFFFGLFFLFFIKFLDLDEIVRIGGNKLFLRSKRVGWLLGVVYVWSGREDVGSLGDGVGISVVGREDVDFYRFIVCEVD